MITIIRLTLAVMMLAAALSNDYASPLATGDPTVIDATAPEKAAGTDSAEDINLFQNLESQNPDNDVNSNTYKINLELARKMLQSGEFSDAQQTLTQLVTALEDSGSRYAPALSEPLHLLGEALHGEGNYPDAVDAYERAVFIIRIEQGLHSPEQARIVYDEAESLLAMGDETGANNKEEYAYEMLLRSYSEDDIRLLPGIYKLADWYMRSRNIFSARDLYGRAVLLVSNTFGGSTPTLIPALNGIADTYLAERFPPYAATHGRGTNNTQSIGNGHPTMARAATVVNRFSKGELALQQIVRIRLDDPASTTVQKTDAIMKLADWYLLFLKMKRASSLYAHVREILESDPNVDHGATLKAYFDAPVALYLPLPRLSQPAGPRSQGTAKRGYVELQFNLTPTGEVRNLKTLASEPRGMMDLKIRRALRIARYRPRITAEGPQPEIATTLKQEFSYYPPPENLPQDTKAVKQ